MYKEYNDMGDIAEARNINVIERRDALMARRELSKPQRLESKKNRHFVQMFIKTYYEDL